AMIEALLKRYSKIAVMVNGNVTGKHRIEAVEKFQKVPRIRLFLGNIKAAGVGLNLTAANTVAFAELDWTPGNHTQAEDRAHRIGTTENVSVYYLIGKDTIEEKLLKVLQSKKKVLNAVLDGRGGGDKLDVYDLLELQLRKEYIS